MWPAGGGAKFIVIFFLGGQKDNCSLLARLMRDRLINLWWKNFNFYVKGAFHGSRGGNYPLTPSPSACMYSMNEVAEENKIAGLPKTGSVLGLFSPRSLPFCGVGPVGVRWGLGTLFRLRYIPGHGGSGG